MSYQLLPLNEHGDTASEPDVEFHKSSVINHTSARLRLGLFLGMAALSGIIFHVIVGFGYHETITNLNGAANASPLNGTTWPSSPSSHPYLRPGLGQYVVPGEEEWGMDRVQEMVSKTKGFYARDYPLELGWNNVSSFHRHIGILVLTLYYRCDTLLKHHCFMLTY